MEGKAAEALPSAAETPSIPAAPIVAPGPIRDEGRVSFELGPGVPYLQRAGLDPSVIHLGSVDGVDLYPGGYPVRSELAFSGAASLRSFDARGLIETPFARGLGSLLPALSFLLGPEVKLDYRRYQARANHEPSARDRFSELGAGSYVLPGEKSIGILSRLGDACRPKITLTW